MKTKQQPTRKWRVLLERVPLWPTDLAARLSITRQALWNLQHVVHSRAPVRLLGKLAKLLARTGMADGSKPPTCHELVRAWFAAKGEQ